MLEGMENMSELELRNPAPAASGSRLAAFARGRADDAAWVRPALACLLAATAFMYLWNLGASGWANAYYSAAAQAGSVSWKAFFFGSFDASSFVTIDKTPAALWLMSLSVRLFGLNSWSVLAPEALCGVASVAVLYATIRRWFSAPAALLAGAIMALTPVAAMMFRFNNPDALLVLVLLGAAYATVRALEAGSTRWLVLATSLVGLGFMVKMMQAFLVMPAIGLVFLVAAPTSLRRRLVSLVVAGAAMLVSSGWWVAIVELTPASLRPYVGGSQDNSMLNLIFGYNGFGRLTGNETGSVGGGGAPGQMWGPTGWDRVFLPSFGGQVSWLIPASVVLLGAGLWLTRRAPRTDRTRAALLLWGGWLLVNGIVFSYASGIIHPYYTIVLAPAIGAVIGIGLGMLWPRRDDIRVRFLLALVLVATVAWAYVLLGRSADWYPHLRTIVLAAGVLAVVGLVAARRGRAGTAVAGVALLAALAGPTAYTLDTVLTAHDGAIPSAGPAVAGGQGRGNLAPTGPGGGNATGQLPFQVTPGDGVPTRPRDGRVDGNRVPVAPGSVFPQPINPGGGGPGGPGGAAGAAGGVLNGSRPGDAVVAMLQADAGRYRWVAATVGANSAAGYQLATQDAVMAIGGFNGTDPTPTLEAFQSMVAAGQVHYFIGGSGGFGGPGGGAPGGFGPNGAGPGANGPTTSRPSTEIAAWVTAHYTAQTVDGITIYDLTQAPSA
ncbi:MAG: hypothetical protein QOE92_2494 [Chloroflexota bacterium]|nr:hypothetical protein [Chloroflexota bacterium]